MLRIRFSGNRKEFLLHNNLKNVFLKLEKREKNYQLLPDPFNAMPSINIVWATHELSLISKKKSVSSIPNKK